MVRSTYSSFSTLTSSAVDQSQQHQELLGKILLNVENRTRGCWVRCANATSVPRLLTNLDRPNEIINVGLLRKVFRIDDRMLHRITGSESNESATFRMKDDRKDGDAVTAVVTLEKFVPNLEKSVAWKRR